MHRKEQVGEYFIINHSTFPGEISKEKDPNRSHEFSKNI